MGGGGVDAFSEGGDAFVVFLWVGEAFGEAVAAGDGAGEPVFFEGFPVFGADEFDGGDAHGGGGGGEGVDGHGVEAPVDDGLADVAFGDFVGSGGGRGEAGDGGGEGGGGGEEAAAAGHAHGWGGHGGDVKPLGKVWRRVWGVDGGAYLKK